jgi:hypothetical protein
LPQFNRKCNVVIKSKDDYLIIDGLRIIFHVEKSIVSKSIDKANIEIYNLSEITRGKIDDIDKYVLLNAGYDYPGIVLSNLFQGDLKLYKHCFENTNIITKLEIYDGFNSLNKTTTISKLENTKIYDVLKEIAKQAKLEIDFKGITINGLKDKILSTGYAFNGKIKDTLDDLSETIDSDYMVQDGVIKLLTRGQYFEGTALLLDETSGMIGIPEKIDDVNTKSGKQKKKNQGQKSVAPGYLITSLLNPTIMPGKLIRLRSQKLKLDSECICYSVTHSGDTHSQDWLSTTRVILTNNIQ